jgi:hypothetical protein
MTRRFDRWHGPVWLGFAPRLLPKRTSRTSHIQVNCSGHSD